MSISVYVDKDSRFGYAQQTTWGTKNVSSMVELETEPFVIKPAMNVLETNRAHQQRYDKDGDTIIDMKGALHTVSPPAFLAKKLEMDIFLYTLFQHVVETDLGAGSGPYKYVFTFPQTQPDFTANGGKFLTLGVSLPVSGRDLTLADVISRQLTLACVPGTQNGYLTLAPEMVGRIYDGADTISSFAAASSATFFNWHAMTAKIGSTELVKGPEGFTLVLGNDADKVGAEVVSGNEYFQTYVLKKYTAELTAQFLWDATTRSAFDKWLSGTAESGLDLSWGTADTDGYLDLAFNGKYNDSDISLTPEGNYVTLHLKCSGTYGSTEPVQITQVHATDRSW